MRHYGILGSNKEGSVGAMQWIDGEEDDDENYLADLISGEDDDDDELESLMTAGQYGDPEIVGAAKRKKAKKAAIRRAVAERVLSKNAGMVVDRPLNRRRRLPSGFQAVTLIALASSNVPTLPQNLFRLERLIVPSEISAFFQINDIKVGNVSQLVQSLPLPATMFSEVSIDTNVWFDTAKVGNQISLDVTNIDTVDEHRFAAGMIGSVAKA